MGKKFEIIENNSTEIDLDDLQYTIRNDDTNRDWVIYASNQRDPRRNLGTMKKNIVKDGLLTAKERDTFFELLEKLGENMLVNQRCALQK
jgi:hypothetical protein